MSSTREIAYGIVEQWKRDIGQIVKYDKMIADIDAALHQRELEVRAEERERAALWDELVKLLKLLAHPKFTTDDQGHIHYYVTRADIEAARALQNRIEQAGDSEDLTCLFCNEQGFDLIGLKSHLQNGDCEEFESLERLRRL